MKRALVVFGGLVFVLGAVAFNVVHKERILSSGRTVLLELAPRDPRSLMQGDYMVLRYAIAQTVRNAEEPQEREGALVLTLDEHGVAQLRRLHREEVPLAPDELLLRYRLRRGELRLGAESFFFQEGHRDRYAQARYGELRVAEDGKSVLVGLRDRDRSPMR